MKIKLNFYIDIGNQLKPTEVSSLMSDLNRQVLNNLVLNSKVLGIEVLSTNKEFEAYMPELTSCNECKNKCEECEEDVEETETESDVEYIDMSDISTDELLEELRSRIEQGNEEEDEE